MRQRVLNGSSSSPVVVESHTSPSQSMSAPASRSSSLPFELPDVDISDLLNTTVQSSKNFPSSLLAHRRNQTKSSTALRTSTQRLSSSQKKAGSKSRDTENSRRTGVQADACHSPAAVGSQPFLATTASDIRNQQTGTRSTLDSDEEFEDFCRSKIAKKRTPEMSQTAECRSETVVSAVGEPHTTAVEVNSPVSNGSNVCSSGCATPPTAPVAANSGSLQKTVAERLNKFAFNDSLMRQRRESAANGVGSTTPPVALPTSRLSAGNW